MRTVGALRDAQKANRKELKIVLVEKARCEERRVQLEAEWDQLERQVEFAKTPGNTPRSRG